MIVEVLNGGALQKRSVGSVPDIVSNYSIAVKNSGKFYIAAEFEASNLPDELVLGNGKVYNGYHNAPLNPGTLYKVHVRAVALDGNGVGIKHGTLSMEHQQPTFYLALACIARNGGSY